MALIQHTRRGRGTPPIVFVHGFGCARSDWSPQVEHFSPQHETVAVDLGGHGELPGTVEHTKIETHGQDVADLLNALDLPPAVLVGHSMGCRVVMEAADRAPDRTCGIILVDGSRLGEAGSRSYEGRAKALADMGYVNAAKAAFGQMFGADFDPGQRQAIIDRALARRPEIAGPLFADIGRYDAQHFDRILASVRVPMLAIQSTQTGPDGKRQGLGAGQSTPYLALLKANIKPLTIEIVPGIGHFPQLERPAETNRMIGAFLAKLA